MRRENDDKGAPCTFRDRSFSQRLRSGFVAQDRQQAARPGKADGASGLQTCRNGQGHQALGRGLRGVRTTSKQHSCRRAIIAGPSRWGDPARPEIDTHALPDLRRLPSPHGRLSRVGLLALPSCRSRGSAPSCPAMTQGCPLGVLMVLGCQVVGPGCLSESRVVYFELCTC